MRRWIAAPLIFAAAIGLLSREAPRAAAQPKGGASAETFRTADGMELHGLFYATDKEASKAPVVVFLYPPGPDRDMTKGDWGSLAKTLNEKGYHVFQFDWRGHGKSTKITNKDAFFKNGYLNSKDANFNAMIQPKGGLKGTFTVKDLGNKGEKFMPAYLNDLAAVRHYLDTKNDNKELNSSSIYIVGAGDAAALGMAWLAAEWNRPSVVPGTGALGVNVPGYEFVPQALIGGVTNEAGADFGGAVWLSAARPSSFPQRAMQNWIAPPVNMNQAYAPKMRENNPMLFMFAEKDTNGERQAKWFFNEMLAADPKKGGKLDPVEQTKLFPVKGGESLQGIKLLGQNAALKTEDNIVFYFDFIQKQRQKLASKARKYDNPYYIDVRYFGLGTNQ